MSDDSCGGCARHGPWPHRFRVLQDQSTPAGTTPTLLQSCMGLGLPHTSFRQVLQSESQDIAEARRRMLFIAAVTAGACVARIWVDPQEREQLVAWMGAETAPNLFSRSKQKRPPIPTSAKSNLMELIQPLPRCAAWPASASGHNRCLRPAGRRSWCLCRKPKPGSSESFVASFFRTGYGLIQQPHSA